eukprot:4161866-Pleurochrysis_carterae.AAC.2
MATDYSVRVAVAGRVPVAGSNGLEYALQTAAVPLLGRPECCTAASPPPSEPRRDVGPLLCMARPVAHPLGHYDTVAESDSASMHTDKAIVDCASK